MFKQKADDIAAALAADGYIVVDDILPETLLASLTTQARSLTAADYKAAGIGRDQALQRNAAIRNDEICWIESANPPGKAYLEWMEQLRCELNRRLFIGLFDYESHYAHYAPGACYKKHIDAFRGSSNRMVTTVLYLNKNWQAGSGGELLIYASDSEQVIEKVIPEYGRLVVFLSAKFPHEVLPALQDRYSIAGWFRLNNSSSQRVDPL